MRTTRKQIDATFDLFCQVSGYRKASSFDDVGALRIDHNPVYGGYVIERICNSGGGVENVFTEYRLPAHAFCVALHMMTEAFARQ